MGGHLGPAAGPGTGGLAGQGRQGREGRAQGGILSLGLPAGDPRVCIRHPLRPTGTLKKEGEAPRSSECAQRGPRLQDGRLSSTHRCCHRSPGGRGCALPLGSPGTPVGKCLGRKTARRPVSSVAPLSTRWRGPCSQEVRRPCPPPWGPETAGSRQSV